ncbi:hypothetical protein [Hyphomicrobium sp. CS1GBMeth3]|uniref:hypothetical protein n=1 Tax=Hyphomicrobium sp. CS1GBMeth3 TaxID=1892845 RepID=UPI0009FB7B9D|nr:hypothetical protein [Hyphomicrobium sp. CS1GBMeth3]
MVWPIGGRRPRSNKHAFEEALEEARLDPDGDGPLWDDEAGPLGPAVGSLGDIAVASGYVAPASLAQAYDGERDLDEPTAPVRPREAAAKLKDTLAVGTYAATDLQRMRRRFASLNHPDRVPEHLRQEAVTAMAEINAEIDRALKQAKG